MKKILAFGFAVLFVLGGTSPARAQSGETIDDFAVRIDVTNAGILHITETIVYNFGTNERHGIFRAIPQRDYLPNNKVQPYFVGIGNVLQDGSPAMFTQEDAGDYLNLTIGNPDVTITGVHTYSFDYVVTNGLKRITQDTTKLKVGDVDLYWDVIGNEWDVPIAKASALITLPGIPKLARCTFGPIESTATCQAGADQNKIFFKSPQGLNPFEAMTVAIQLDPTAFTGLANPIINDAPISFAEQAKSMLPYSVGLGAITSAIVGIFAVRRRKRVHTFPIEDFVRFEPPAHLRPAQLQAAWHGHVDSKGFTATLLDLSVRGVVSLSLQDKDLVVTAKGLNKPMADWEKTIIDIVLDGSKTVVLDTYRADIAIAITLASSRLCDEAVAKKYRNPQALKSRKRFIGLSVLFGAGLIASFFLGAPKFFSLFAGMAAFGLVTSLISILIVPVEQTKESAEFLGQVEGFRKLLDTDAAEDRREFAQRSGLDPAGIFATMLPYAVIYELDKSWCASFPDLTPAQLSSYGFLFVDTSHMSNSLHTATQSLSAAMTPPSSNGSGGDGGSAGGGGGGGGGGSW